MKISMETSVKELNGVGEARAALLAKLGIFNVKQLLYHFPRGYEFRGNVKPLAAAEIGQTGSFILTVATDVKLASLRRGMNICKLRAFDESASCDINYFNQPYMKDVLKKGCEYRFYGKLTMESGRLTLTSPTAEPVIEGRPLPQLVAVYPMTSGLSQKIMSKLIRDTIGAISTLCQTDPSVLPDPIPEKIREENNLPSLLFALKNIHFPDDFDLLNIAKRRLIFEEFFLFVSGTSSARDNSLSAPTMKSGDISPLTDQLRFELTGAQKRAIADITADLSSRRPMRRLLSGDVGSGKTAVAAAAAYIAAHSGYQCALMAPTEILAVQHFCDLSPLFENIGISCRLLTGSTPASERRKILGGLADGSIKFVIGTHALINENVAFSNLGLVICDEQHRFGVGQREELLRKASAALAKASGGDGSDGNCQSPPQKFTAHLLTMSATPIPRTLAMILYGDIDISILNELPPGRQRVSTFVVNEDYRSRLNGFIIQQHNEGHQTYVVCPTVEESDDGEVTLEDTRLMDLGYDVEELTGSAMPKAAVTFSKELANSLPELTVGCVHGKLKPDEKDKIMKDFSSGKIDVLVATTVIEVGVNVPSATLMIIENAERFGLSQLHQLRGRVGRGDAKSYCVLVSGAKRDSRAYKRLEALKNTFDGFKIAEYDLGERGPGDFFSSFGSDQAVRQHGDLRFRLANLCEDMNLLEAAVSAAKKCKLNNMPNGNEPNGNVPNGNKPNGNKPNGNTIEITEFKNESTFS